MTLEYGDLIGRHNPSQSHWELNELLLELELIDVRRVLEIGMHQGGSARVWREALDPDLLIGVNERDELVGDRDRLTTIFGRSQTADVHSRVVTLLAGQPLDYLFIDGGHLYDEVARDYELYGPLVRPGGLIAFHDARLTGNPTCDVHRFWDNVRVGHRTKLIWDGTETGTGEGLLFV